MSKTRFIRLGARSIAVTLTASAAVVAGVAAPAFAGHDLPAQGTNPDQWHCGGPINGSGDQICLHLNQFLGWWTGFNAEYHHFGPALLRVKLYWSSDHGQSGSFNEVPLGVDQVAKVDSGADLPSYTCISVWSRNTTTTGYSYVTEPTTVCRDN
jgi:hypothetical protein